MEDNGVDGDNEMTDEELLLTRRKQSRRQRQQLRFAEEEDPKEHEKQQKSPSNFKPPGRASRFLSIADATAQLPNAEALLRLQQLHDQSQNKQESAIPSEISDELLDKLPFKIEIIPDRRDDFLTQESSIARSRKNNKEPSEISEIIPSGLSKERRLQIIEEILKKLSQTNVLDDIRRAHAVPFHLPKNNQMQKNVAKRIQDLTGSDIVMLNDHLYMKNLCKLLADKHQKELEEHFQELELNEKRRCLFESIKTSE